MTRGAQPAGGIAPDADQAALWGFARTLALEHPELRPASIDLDPSPVTLGGADLLAAVLDADGEDQVALRAGARLVARLVVADAPDATAARDAAPVELALESRGTLDALTRRPMVRRAPGPGEVEIEVLATGLNFKDVLNALDMYPGDPGPLGSECAGVVAAVGAGVTDRRVGEAVVALAPGCFRSYVTCDAGLVVAKPTGTSFAEAAGMLIAHVTARFALDHVARLQAGERVLVHAAAGGVGLAAVGAAQRVGAEVFATAGNDRKRALLEALGVAHVYDSRSLDFADQILADTDGAGVDVVLNSLAGDFVRRSLDVLAPGGRFVEIGKRDHLGEQLGDERSYHVVDWGAEARADPALIRSIMEGVTASAAEGSLLRLPLRTFPLADAQAAFRFMAQARHVGKVVITHRRTSGRPVPDVRADGTYLVTGGLGGLGLLTARHLVELGARHLVLMGRRPPSAVAAEAVDALRADGVDVLVVEGDVARTDDVDRVLAAVAATDQPLRGVVHAAGALDNGAIGQLDWARFAGVLAAKVDGARHLDRATADAPLDAFVAYASVASVLGSPGQANHAAANAYLDALAHRRSGDGLASVSIDWGAWSEVGAAADLGVVEMAGAHGLGVITPDAGIAALDRLPGAAVDPQPVFSPIDWPVLLRRYAGGPPPLLSGMAARGVATVSAAATVEPSRGRRRSPAPGRRLAGPAPGDPHGAGPRADGAGAGPARRRRRRRDAPERSGPRLADGGRAAQRARHAARARRAAAGHVGLRPPERRGHRRPPGDVARSCGRHRFRRQRRRRSRPGSATRAGRRVARHVAARRHGEPDRRRDRRHAVAPERAMSELFDRLSNLPPKRLALLAMELQDQLDAAEPCADRADRHRRDGLSLPGAVDA